MKRGCPCGFDGSDYWPAFGAGWHRAHREAHLATFPDVDQRTRDNLDSFIRWAEERDQ